MTTESSGPNQGRPVLYLGHQQSSVICPPPTDMVQRADSITTINTLSSISRCSLDERTDAGNKTSVGQPRCRESAKHFLNSGDCDKREHAAHQEGPYRTGCNRETFVSLYTSPPPSYATHKKPDSAVQAQTSGCQNGRWRRGSTRSNSLLTDSSARMANWSPTCNSGATATWVSQRRCHLANPMDFFDEAAIAQRPSTGISYLNRGYSHAIGSTHSLPEDISSGRVHESVRENGMSSVNSARTLRAPDGTSLRSQPCLISKERDSPVPIRVQDTQDNYIREDAQTDLVTGLQAQLNEKSPTEAPDGKPLTLLHEIAFVFVISVAQALMLAGVSQALIPATIIGQSFGLTRAVDLAWFSAAYALTSGTFVLPAGRLGDLFGHKTVFVAGFFWFAAWSLAAGFALQVHASGGSDSGAGSRGVIYFNVCRAVQGIGPALQVPNGQAMLGRAYKPGPRKALVMSLFGAAAPFGFVAGGAMSSFFAQFLTWSWSFWTLAATCFVFGSLSILVLPATPVAGRNDTESFWAQLDGAGIVLGVSGLVLFNFAWNQAAQVTWGNPYVYSLLIVSLLLLAAFVFVELRAAHPLVPVSAMRFQTNFLLACTAAGWGSFSIWVFYSFQFLEVLRGWSPLLAAASHSPGPLTGLAASLLVARYMARAGPHWIMLASMAAFLVGSLLMATAPVDQAYWANTLFSVLVMPFGMDMSGPAAIIMLSNSVGGERQGVAASLVVTVINYSISTALGLAAAVEIHTGGAGADVLAGFRGAQYFGVGLGAMGCAIALAFALATVCRECSQAGLQEKRNEVSEQPASHTSITSLPHRSDLIL
jgi:MFS family permease